MTEPSERPATGAPSAPATPTLADLAKMIAAIGGADRGRKKDKGDRGRKASPRSGSPAARTRTVYGDASFKGCWHCGKEHTPINRKQCPEFKKMLKDNKGELPKGYKGKYELWKENQKKKKDSVASLTPGHDTESDDDSDDDSDHHCNAVWTRAKPGLKSILKQVDKSGNGVVNSFGALSDPSDQEEESIPLEAWAHKVRRAGDSKQRRKTKGSLKTLTITTDADVHTLEKTIGATSKSMKVKMQVAEDVALDDLAKLIEDRGVTVEQLEEQCDYVWAMMDSGSTVDVADCEEAFPHHEIVRRSIMKKLHTMNLTS